MRYTPNTFLYGIKQLVTGNNRDNNNKSFDGGIKVEKFIPLDTLINYTTQFPALTDNSGGTASPTIAAIGGTTYATDAPAIKNAIAQFAKMFNAAAASNATLNSGKQPVYSVPSGTNPSIGTFSIPTPRDYDEASDTFAIKMFVSLANADAAITVTGTPTIQPIGGSATTGTAVNGKAPFSTAASTALTTTEQVIEFNFSLLGLKRDGILAVTFAVAGTTTGNTNIYALEYIYDSTIVSYNETDSTTNTNSSTGNLLR